MREEANQELINKTLREEESVLSLLFAATLLNKADIVKEVFSPPPL